LHCFFAFKSWGRFASPLRSARLRKAGLEVAMAVAVVLLIVNASYFFKQGIWTRDGLSVDPDLRGSRLLSRIEGGTPPRIAHENARQNAESTPAKRGFHSGIFAR